MAKNKQLDIELVAENESASGVTMADLTEAEVLPEVQEHAIAAVQESIAEAEAIADIEAPHGRNKDGTPKKKRGRKAGGSNTPKQTQAPFDFGEKKEAENVAAVAPGVDAPIDSTHAAVFASGIIEGFTVGAISKAWQLEKPERERNIMAWKNAFDHYGGVALSPPLALVADHLMIVQKRVLSDSITKSRISLGWTWLKTKFKRRDRDERTPDDVGE